MKRALYYFVVTMFIVGYGSALKAQVKLTGNIASAELVSAITITNTAPMNFGVISIPQTEATVLMNTSGTRTPTGATIVESGTQRTVAEFSLHGTPNDNYTITLPTSISVFTAGGGGEGLIKEMVIDHLVVKVDASDEVAYTGPIHTPQLSAAGVSTFLLAGTLNIKSLQTLGVYSGTYQVTVDYF